jgi:hypothetical protein
MFVFPNLPFKIFVLIDEFVQEQIMADLAQTWKIILDDVLKLWRNGWKETTITNLMVSCLSEKFKVIIKGEFTTEADFIIQNRERISFSSKNNWKL